MVAWLGHFAVQLNSSLVFENVTTEQLDVRVPKLTATSRPG